MEQSVHYNFRKNGICPHSTVSQSVNVTGSTAVLEDKAAQRHKSDGMFSTLVPANYLTKKEAKSTAYHKQAHTVHVY
jgi:hypothetical protein